MGNLIDLKKKLTAEDREIVRSELDRKRKSVGVAYLLWFFLSMVGLHKFYLGKPVQGLVYILMPIIGIILFFVGAGSEDGGVIGLSIIIWCSYILYWVIDLFTLHMQTEKTNEKIEIKLINKMAS